jgi:hypothetical protein
MRVRVAIGIALVTAGAVVAGLLMSGPAAQARLLTPGCAWPVAVNANVLAVNNRLNVSNPDSQAAYWIMPFKVQPGLRITLSGRYPDSRYMSVAVYGSHGLPFTENGTSSELTDYQIEPNPGSVNPWQHRATPGGGFAITFLSDPPRGARNALPLAPAGTPKGSTGLIFYRVYVPAEGNVSRVPLPEVTFTRDHESRRLSTCPATTHPSEQAIDQITAVEHSGGSTAPTAPTTLAQLQAELGPSGILPFFRGPAAVGSTPNVGSSYLKAVVLSPRPGDVLLIRGKAPSTPHGSHPHPWPAAGENLRYWSMCIDQAAGPKPVVINHLGDGRLDFGCRYDNEVKVDRHGDYVFVVGTEAQRPAIDRTKGTTFLPLSLKDPDQPYILNLRNTLANPGFADSVLNVPANDSPAAAAAVMGRYYPRATFCSFDTFVHGGVDGCLRTSS